MIPKIVHHVWPGRDPFREKFHAWRMTWMKKNPEYTFCFWDLDTLPYHLFTPGAEEILKSDATYICKAEVVKYQIVYALGGIYTDTDMECLKNFDPLMGVESFCGKGHAPDNITNAIFASVKGTPLFKSLCEIVVDSVNNESYAWRDPKRLLNTQGGMRVVGLSHLSKMEKVHPVETFFPTWCLDPPAKRKGPFPNSFTNHHWNGMEKDGWTHAGS